MGVSNSTGSVNAVLIYDGDCGFCTSCVDYLKRRLKAMPEAVPFQSADLHQLGLSRERAQKKVWLVLRAKSSDATEIDQFGGHFAFAELLRHQPEFSLRLLGNLLVTQPFSLIASLGYFLIARYRHKIPAQLGGNPSCEVPKGRG